MQEKIVTLKNYDTMANALLDQDVLKSNGIDNFINNEQFAELYPMFNELDQGLKIVVFEKDYERAMKLLDEFHSVDIASE